MFCLWERVNEARIRSDTWFLEMTLRKPKRVYFIGSGPSMAMGLPSVENLVDEIMKRYEGFEDLIVPMVNDCYRGVQKIAKMAFPYLQRDQINFEELLTILDETGTAPEIYKTKRISEGGLELPGSTKSVKELYSWLLNETFTLLAERMADPSLWREHKIKTDNLGYKEKSSIGLTEQDLTARKNIKKVIDYYVKIKSRWWEQYEKINPLDKPKDDSERYSYFHPEFRDFVITTNYDLMVEYQLIGRYCYANPQTAKTLILKVHGSINWYELQPDEFFRDEEEEILLFKEKSRIAGRQFLQGNVLQQSFPKEPLIAPPITLKKYDDPLFKQMFWQASNVLLEADELVILGYGFSNYDFYVKKLLDLAINSPNSNIHKIYHFDKNDKLRNFFEGDENMGINPFLRKGSLIDRYKFQNIDFSKFVPNFEDIEGPPIPIFN